MAQGKHESVSSSSQPSPKSSREEVGAGTSNPYESVSGEGAFLKEDQGPETISEQFEGKSDTGEIESAAGFDPTRAFNEGMPMQFLTDELTSLEMLHPEEYPNPETVCGNDDRVRISPATAVPWRWICQLIITFPNGARSRCTGWFIGHRTVMTAGHCVFSRGNGGWARSIEVIPGLDAASRPFGSQVGTSFRSVTGWTSSGDHNYDYGAIILPNGDLGNRVGWFGFASLSNASLNNLLINNSGYPGDKPFGTQWFNAGRVANATARKIYYMVDTFGGQSGSPVWRYQNGQRHAVGIHAYGGCPNSATRITAPVFNNMLAWKNV